MRDWGALAVALNALNRSMGLIDPYPFGLSAPVHEKLRFAHDIVRRGHSVSAEPSWPVAA